MLSWFDHEKIYNLEATFGCVLDKSCYLQNIKFFLHTRQDFMDFLPVSTKVISFTLER